jgi:hypothetical protein
MNMNVIEVLKERIKLENMCILLEYTFPLSFREYLFFNSYFKTHSTIYHQRIIYE